MSGFLSKKVAFKSALLLSPSVFFYYYFGMFYVILLALLANSDGIFKINFLLG